MRSLCCDCFVWGLLSADVPVPEIFVLKTKRFRTIHSDETMPVIRLEVFKARQNSLVCPEIPSGLLGAETRASVSIGTRIGMTRKITGETFGRLLKAAGHHEQYERIFVFLVFTDKGKQKGALRFVRVGLGVNIDGISFS